MRLALAEAPTHQNWKLLCAKYSKQGTGDYSTIRLCAESMPHTAMFRAMALLGLLTADSQEGALLAGRGAVMADAPLASQAIQAADPVAAAVPGAIPWTPEDLTFWRAEIERS